MKRLTTIAEKKEIGTWQDPSTKKVYKTIVAWASKPVLDRAEEVIDADAWDLKEFSKNPVLMLSHDYRQLPIGSVMWTKKTPEGLKFKARFASTDIAQDVAKLYEEDIMRAFSVGFIPKDHVKEKTKKDGKEIDIIRWTKAELLEISCVAIGCCPDALIENAQKGVFKSIELKETVDFVTSHKYTDSGEIIEIEKSSDETSDDSQNLEVLEINEEDIQEDGCNKPKKPKKDENVIEDENITDSEDNSNDLPKEDSPCACCALDTPVGKVFGVLTEKDETEFFVASIENGVQNDISIGFEIKSEDVEKPYANEHACRINDPGKYARFARKNCAQKSDGKCIDVIYGIKEGKTEIQALRYPKDIWSADEARKHCSGRNGSFEAAKSLEEPDRFKKLEEELLFLRNAFSDSELRGKELKEGLSLLREMLEKLLEQKRGELNEDALEIIDSQKEPTEMTFDSETTTKIVAEVVGKIFDEKVVKGAQQKIIDEQVNMMVAKLQGKVLY